MIVDSTLTWYDGADERKGYHMQQQTRDIKFTLRTARLVNDLTQEQAARALGVAKNTLASYEHSQSYPDVVILKRMEKLYGIRYDQLVFPELM